MAMIHVRIKVKRYTSGIAALSCRSTLAWSQTTSKMRRRSLHHFDRLLIGLLMMCVLIWIFYVIACIPVRRNHNDPIYHNTAVPRVDSIMVNNQSSKIPYTILQLFQL